MAARIQGIISTGEYEREEFSEFNHASFSPFSFQKISCLVLL